jgi:hypothetical protein
MTRELTAALLIVGGILVFMYCTIALGAFLARRAIDWADARDRSEAERERAKQRHAAIDAYER